MKILLYSPDNGVTRNFMPHLWMFLLKALTPPEHEVFLIDGNAQPMTEAEIARFVRENNIELAGISAMTRMAARAYRMADAIRGAGAKVVFGGPHVTEVPDEPLGRAGEPRHADAIALGEADHTWPRIVADAAAGRLQEIYRPVDDHGVEVKPSLADYPVIPWETIDLDQFNMMRKVPGFANLLLRRFTADWKSLYIVPIESGRGCPYGCDFCTVTGFFGDSIRFRTNQSVINELLSLKRRARAERGHIGVFFIDDNFAINVKRTKSLLREMIAQEATVAWVAQISINLLKDEELLDLIAASGGRWIFIGLESVDAASLSAVNKGFNKPADYKLALDRLAQRGIYAITSFIFGMDGDTPGVAKRTQEVMDSWPPGLPVYGLMTPYPATPLYDRLLQAGRLTRPKHWLDFKPFQMAYTPDRITIEQSEAEVREAWTRAYSPEAIAEGLRRIRKRPFKERSVMFFARLAFRGIYFPQMRARHWALLMWKNRHTLLSLCYEAYVSLWRDSKKTKGAVDGEKFAAFRQ
jgi:radical SAM superfamily enzyme YgiQ (UPF0313 family)